MSKKIAFLLIIFIVGSWCVFADDEDNDGLTDGWGWYVLGAVCIVLLIGGIFAIGAAASGDKEGAQKIMGSLSAEEQGKANLITTIMNNPIVKHTTIDISKDNKTFVGVRFAW